MLWIPASVLSFTVRLKFAFEPLPLYSQPMEFRWNRPCFFDSRSGCITTSGLWESSVSAAFVAQSLSLSDSLQPHGLQHNRLPCFSLSLEFAQTHVHWVGDAIQPSHPLSPPSPPALCSLNECFKCGCMISKGFPGGAVGKESACQCRRSKRLRFYLWVRKISWSRNGNPLQYSCLENFMDRGAWQATVYGVTKEPDTTEHAHVHDCQGQ